MTVGVERLRELLSYDAGTGEFVWRNSRRGISGGRIAGCINAALGYRQIGIDGRRYYAHRLAWLYVHSGWPDYEIDHANGNRLDNSIANLRLATSAQNKQNRRIRKDNSSGYKGVFLHRKTGKWRALIRHQYKSISLGLFDDPSAAHAAYAAAADRLYGDFARHA